MPQTLPIPFCGGEGDHALQTCLPPLVGGRGTTKWWKGAAEGGIIKTAAKPLPPSSEPGPRSGPSSRPLPSRCARHPPPGRGWAGNMEEKNVALKTCRLWVEGGPPIGGIIKNCGEAATTTFSAGGAVAPLSEANHNPSTQPAAPAAPPFLKLAAKPPPSPSARRAVKPKNLTNPRGKAPSTLTPKACPMACPMRADYLENPSFSWRSPCSSVFRGQARLKRRKPSPSFPKTYPMSSHRWQS